MSPAAGRPAPRRLGLALTFLTALAVAGCSTGAISTAPAGSGRPIGSCPASAPPPMAADQTATVTIETPKGSIVIGVQGQLGPRAAANFVALARCGFYTGVVFHRLVPGYLIQGGDGVFGRSSTIDQRRMGSGGPGYLFADDPVTVPYGPGIVAMANAGPNTNGSQFFVLLAQPDFGPNYSVFGRVTSGLDVVEAIASMPNDGSEANRPIDPVAMTSVTVTTP